MPDQPTMFTLDGGLFDDVATLATTPIDELDLPREVTRHMVENLDRAIRDEPPSSEQTRAMFRGLGWSVTE